MSPLFDELAEIKDELNRYDNNSQLNLYFKRWGRITKKLLCNENARVIQKFCRKIHYKYLRLKKQKKAEKEKDTKLTQELILDYNKYQTTQGAKKLQSGEYTISQKSYMKSYAASDTKKIIGNDACRQCRDTF